MDITTQIMVKCIGTIHTYKNTPWCQPAHGLSRHVSLLLVRNLPWYLQSHVQCLVHRLLAVWWCPWSSVCLPDAVCMMCGWEVVGVVHSTRTHMHITQHTSIHLVCNHKCTFLFMNTCVCICVYVYSNTHLPTCTDRSARVASPSCLDAPPPSNPPNNPPAALAGASCDRRMYGEACIL